jgi:hypothetical protein
MIDFTYVAPPTVEIVIASDAVRNGISKTNGSVYTQVGAETTVGPIYVGAAASNADYLIGADYDLTAYAGVKTELKGVALDGRVSFTKLYGENAWGLEDAATTVSVTASKTFGPIAASASVAYTPNDLYTGDAATYVSGNAAYRFGKNEVSAGLGRYSTDLGAYNTWNVGYGRDLTPKLTVDLRYYGTDKGEFGGPFDDRAVASLRVKF